MPFVIDDLERRGVRLPSVEVFAANLVSMNVADACWISESGAITDVSIQL